MKKNHLSLRRTTCRVTAIAAGLMMLASCAQDGFDDETWKSDVKNTALASPSAEEISISASADGSQTVISWPVVHGAGGYLCTVMDVTDAENPVALNNIADSVIDRCQIAVSREIDHNYTFSIKTLGNAQLNNTDAAQATLVAFNSFTAALGTIPAGSDITEYVLNNPMPEEAVTTQMAYDLVAGAEYTISGDIDFGNKLVQLRTTDVNNRAKVTFTANASIMTATGLTLKNVDFDCSQSTEPFIAMSETPDASTQGVISGSQQYYDVQQSLVLQNCHFTGVNNYFIYDNDVKYCLGTAIISDCVVQLTGVGVQGVIRFSSGFINDLTIENSTIYGVAGADAGYFVQYNNNGRATRGGYASNSITYANCTFYNVANTGQWGNYQGFRGQSTSYWNMTNCIFVECGNKQVPRRFLHGQGNVPNRNFANNTYMYAGEFESIDGSVASYDDSGTAIESDPGFADPANGNFSISGSTQAQLGTGDPRWLQ